MKRAALFTFAFLFAFLLVCCGQSVQQPPAPGTPPPGYQDWEDNPLSSARGFYGSLPKGLRPSLLVNGKLYRWSGSTNIALPSGYEPLGRISGVTEEIPTEELQLRAGFYATGTVYTDPEKPEVVYALMTGEWLWKDYVRFVTDDLMDDSCIIYGQQPYCFRPSSELCEIVRELPETCISVGWLHYVGMDVVPVNDLETNCDKDSHNRSMENREVWVDPNDSSVIYVYHHMYWSQGDYPAWVVCPLWE